MGVPGPCWARHTILKLLVGGSLHSKARAVILNVETLDGTQALCLGLICNKKIPR